MSKSEPLVPVVLNVTLDEADVQFSVCLPVGTKAFEIRATDEVRWAVESGKVAGSVSPYATLKAGDTYKSPDKMGWS